MYDEAIDFDGIESEEPEEFDDDFDDDLEDDGWGEEEEWEEDEALEEFDEDPAAPSFAR